MPDTSGQLEPNNASGDSQQSFGIHQEIQTLKDDMKSVRSDLAALAEKAAQAASDKAKRGADKAADKAGAMAGEAKAAAESYAGLLEDRVRAHPLASIGIALAAGMVIASLGRR